MGTPVVTLTTDYGTSDPFVAVCKGVLLERAPGVTLVDITHHVPPGDVGRGARLLADAVPYLAAAAHLAVVDPGVGTARRPVALRSERGDALVGPDNGLLTLAAAELGGVVAAVELDPGATPGPRGVAGLSRTFHGRDLFAPAAGLLAGGRSLDALGDPIDPGGLVTLPPPVREVGPGWVRAEVRAVDHFGNLQLAVQPEDLRSAGLVGAGIVSAGTDSESLVRAGRGHGGGRDGAPGTHGPGESLISLQLPSGQVHLAPWVGTFGEVSAGRLAVLEDSSGFVQVSVTGGSAAATLGLAAGIVLTLHRGGPDGRP